MKKLIYRAVAFVCLLATTLSFTACQTDDAQAAGSSVQLHAFGPTPVLRGSDISFLGENLDKVTEIILPDNISITDIKVESSEKITITVPQEATVGYVTLVYPGGSITTQTMMGYTEPYEITSISPVDKSVRAGDEITISGDYLNNIVAVVFGGGAKVEMDSFIAQERSKIVVELPAEAISGKLYVEDGNGNQLYSDDELTILQPTISTIAPLKIKAGNELTITGDNLDLVASIEFAGAQTATEFASQSKSKIVVATPAAIADGTISITSFAGQVVASVDALECVVPTSLSTAAADGYKAGKTMTISGKDLDLVTAVQFSGSAAASEFTYDSSISVVIPSDATSDVITLTTAAAKSVTTPAITLVAPVVVSLESIDILSGEDIIVHGKDFDLVTGVTLAGVDMEYTYDAESGDITVATLRDSKSGDLKFTTANGTSVHVATMTVTLDAIVNITSMPSSAASGDEITIEGSKFNMIETMYIGSSKVTSFTSRSDSSMTFIVPEVEAGEYNLAYTLTTGENETSVGTITVGVVLTRVDVWTGELTVSGWGNVSDLAWQSPSPFADMPSGATLVFEFTQTGGGETQLKLCNPDGWSVLPGPRVNDWGVITGFTTETTSYSYAFADSEIEVFKTKGIVISGQHFTLTALYYTY